MLLRSATAVAAKALVVSYPRIDLAQARARVPSFYALEIIRAAEGRFSDKRPQALLPQLLWPSAAACAPRATL